MSDCLENRYSQFDIQSPRESISRSANVGVSRHARVNYRCPLTSARITTED